jgi:hypothetical protein
VSINEIHFMREKLVQGHRGRWIPTMQVSYSNASALHPIYKEAAFYEHSEVSQLYHELGGGRHEGALMGSTVILPHRSLWASMWRISPAEVQVISSPAGTELSAEAESSRHDKARARDRLMRD